jgi:hypothetical protein
VRRPDRPLEGGNTKSLLEEGEEKMKKKTRSASKREMIEPHRGDKRYVRRTSRGKFGKTVDLGRSLSADRKRLAKAKVSKGQGDRGDRVS